MNSVERFFTMVVSGMIRNRPAGDVARLTVPAAHFSSSTPALLVPFPVSLSQAESLEDALMASPDRRLLELLLPIFEQHADLVETVLPEHLRSNWRQAVAFADRTPGPKKRDHRDLLLAMAALEGAATLPARALAITVVSQLPTVSRGGSDDRLHVQLADGSRPARKDLIDRLERSFDAKKERLLGEVEMAHDLASRATARLERIKSGNGMFTATKPARARRTLDGNQVRALHGARFPAVTAINVDQVSKAITKRPKKP